MKYRAFVFIVLVLLVYSALAKDASPQHEFKGSEGEDAKETNQGGSGCRRPYCCRGEVDKSGRCVQYCCAGANEVEPTNNVDNIGVAGYGNKQGGGGGGG
ncbi:hypothetical protein ACJIZ3_023234 [Penstemon smallii]|uniref:Uncharacterized protein n=1 Tax=Penstemon smallii TaxID=265156 RepID=A0ABD3TQI9_9LAMI